MQQQQQPAGWMADVYRVQIESVQDLTTASLEGFERVQQLGLQAMRQQLDDQLRIMSAVTARSAEAMADPQVARPAVDRLFGVQRQIADAMVQTNQRVLSAVNPAAGRAGTSAGSEARGAFDAFSSVFDNALQQWHQVTSRMLDVMQEQMARATEDAQRMGAQAQGALREAGNGGTAGLSSGGMPAQPQVAGQGQGPGQGQGQGQGGNQQQRGPAKSGERKHELA